MCATQRTGERSPHENARRAVLSPSFFPQKILTCTKNGVKKLNLSWVHWIVSRRFSFFSFHFVGQNVLTVGKYIWCASQHPWEAQFLLCLQQTVLCVKKTQHVAKTQEIGQRKETTNCQTMNALSATQDRFNEQKWPQSKTTKRKRDTSIS